MALNLKGDSLHEETLRKQSTYVHVHVTGSSTKRNLKITDKSYDSMAKFK
jgi:hypothetical protein